MSSPCRLRRGSLRRFGLAGMVAAALVVRPTFGSVGEAVVDTVGAGHASGSAAESAPADIVALRALLRTGSGQGDFVHIPAVEQVVYFHVAFRVDGPGGLINVSLRASIDGEEFCGVDAPVASNAEFTGRCTQGWTVTPGVHTLAWQLSVEAEESNPDNNTVSRTWSTGAPLDARADRVYWRTGRGSGVEVAAPAAGQNVYAHFEWTFVGPGGQLDVSLRSTIDGVALCGGPFRAESGQDYSLWCDDPWSATAGAHTLRWDLDLLDQFAESDEDNNDAAVSFVVASPSPTRTATRTAATPTPTAARLSTATPTPVRTATATANPDATPTPATATRGPTASALASAVSPSASPTPGDGEILDAFGRGDANCDFSRSAADFVAQALRDTGAIVCGNDDCDRDGAVTEADRTCAAGCIFGLCPVPPHAPRVTTVMPESATGIAPLSFVRVRGSGLDNPDTLVSVRIGDTAAPFVDPDEGDLVVIVPLLPAGPADLVVFAGDLASAPFRIEVADSASAGGAAGAGGVAAILAAIDEVAAAFLALDLADIYAEAQVPIVRDAVQRFRDELAAIDVDALLAPAERAEIDRLIDASGLIEFARSVRDELLGGAGSGGAGLLGAAAAGVAAQSVAAKVAKVGRVMRGGARTVAKGVGGVAGRLGLLVRATSVASVAATIILGTKEYFDSFEPTMTDILFADAAGASRSLPTAGGLVRVQGENLSLAETVLQFRTAFLPSPGTSGWVSRAALRECGASCLEYSLPDRSGVCGDIAFRLENSRTPRAVGTAVQPVLLSPGLSISHPNDKVNLGTTGVVPGYGPCEVEVSLEGPAPLGVRRRTYPQPFLLAVPGGHWLQVTPRVKQFPEKFQTLLIAPGVYFPRVHVGSETSQEDLTFQRFNDIADLRIACDLTDLVLDPGTPNVTTCRAHGFAADGSFVEFPVDTVVEPSLTTDAVSVAPADGIDPNLPGNASLLYVFAERPGISTLTAEAFTSSGRLGGSATGATFTVHDATLPTVAVTNLDCGEFISALPGETKQVIVEAFDNHALHSIRLEAMGDVVSNPSQERGCGGLPHCLVTFDLAFRESGFTESDVAVFIEAADTGGGTTKIQCTFRLDEEPPPGGVTLRKLADTGTEIPGHEDLGFSSFSQVAVSDGTVAFIGLGVRTNGSHVEGIYAGRGDGPLTLVANDNTRIPNAPGTRTFRTGIFDLSLDGRKAVFAGAGMDYWRHRIAIGGDPVNGAELIYDQQGTRLPFGEIESLRYRDPFIAIRFLDGPDSSSRTSSIRVGQVPTLAPALRVVAEVGTPIPDGSGGFTELRVGSGEVSLDLAPDPVVVFLGRGTDNQEGVYVDRGAGLAAVADTSTLAPPSNLPFRFFSGAAADGLAVAFVARHIENRASRSGVYVSRGFGVELVANTTTAIPGGDGTTFGSFNGTVAADSGLIVFEADIPNIPGGGGGVFAELGGRLFRLAATGDVVDGRTVRSVLLQDDDCVDGRDVALLLFFEGGSPAVYKATIRP